MSGLHADLTVVDGLHVANWSPEVFRAQRAAGVTAANCTTCVWEGFDAAMANIAAFKRWFVQHDDLIRPVRRAADVAAAKAEGRVGIVLGWQNSSGIEDRLDRLELFWDLGLRIVQLTYNTQNHAGAGCYEERDTGLSGWGRELVEEMNRLGMLVDLSHVGERTAHDAILHSRQPVVFSHVCPAALKAHPRNKSDEQMRMVAERGGLVGVTGFTWFLAAEGRVTIEHVLDAIEHVIGVVGEDHVGIGSDFVDGHGAAFLEWIMRDKGCARPLGGVPIEQVVREFAMPQGLERIEDLPNLTAAMERRGWGERRIRKLMGENWVRVLGDVWGA